MLKFDEIYNPDSCLNKASLNEGLFILLGRDSAAPQTIRYWIDERIRLGKNKREDEQIIHAEAMARFMESQAKSNCCIHLDIDWFSSDGFGAKRERASYGRCKKCGTVINP